MDLSDEPFWTWEKMFFDTSGNGIRHNYNIKNKAEVYNEYWETIILGFVIHRIGTFWISVYDSKRKCIDLGESENIDGAKAAVENYVKNNF